VRGVVRGRRAPRHRGPGWAVQVDPIKQKLTPPGTKRSKLNCDILLSISAFNFNLRRYTLDGDVIVWDTRLPALDHRRIVAGARPDIAVSRPRPPRRLAFRTLVCRVQRHPVTWRVISARPTGDKRVLPATSLSSTRVVNPRLLS
jgi:hypothetical protein